MKSQRKPGCKHALPTGEGSTPISPADTCCQMLFGTSSLTVVWDIFLNSLERVFFTCLLFGALDVARLLGNPVS